MNAIQHLLNIAQALQSKQQFHKAIEYYDKIIAIDDQAVTAYEERGLCHYALGRIEKALNDLNTAIILSEDNHNAHFNRGLLYLQKKDPENALKDFEKAYIIYGDSLDYLSHLAFTNLLLKNYTACIFYCDKLLDYNAEDTDGLLYKANALLKMEEYKEAIRCYARLGRMYPHEPLFYNNIGFAYALMDLPDLGLKYLNYALEIEPQYPSALSMMGFCWYLKGDFDKALDYINEALGLDPSNAYAYKNRALIYMKLGEMMPAFEDLKMALEMGFTEQYGEEVERILREEFEYV